MGMSFYFIGQGPFSKSLLLRSLIVQSFFSHLRIMGSSDCDDVLSMRSGLRKLKDCKEIDCLHGAAVLRFLVLRASREPGHYIFRGTSSLFQRPMQELKFILNQLNVDIDFNEDSLSIKSGGWQLSGDALHVSTDRSSQFASAVCLSAWGLSHDLFLSIEGNQLSASYFQMTLSFLRSLGMRIDGGNKEYFIPAGQKICHFNYHPESDMSCLFSLAALVGPGDEVVFTNWPEESLQPDFVFPDLLKQMGFQIEIKNGCLKVTRSVKLKPITYNIKNCPDLFPVLAVLLALAEGKSGLYGAPHLKYKESNRIRETVKLLENIGGVGVQVLNEGLEITGGAFLPQSTSPAIVFDPKEDHRMAMAAAVLKKAGWSIRILNPLVVNKSFPDFWSITGLGP